VKTTTGITGARAWAVNVSFVACIILEVLPTEADLLFSVHRSYGLAATVVAKVACTALILLPLIWVGFCRPPISALLASRRDRFVAFVTAVYFAAMTAVFIRSCSTAG